MGDRGIDKEGGVEYYSAIQKNGIKTFAAIWMDLQAVILSEVREIKRNNL